MDNTAFAATLLILAFFAFLLVEMFGDGIRSMFARRKRPTYSHAVTDQQYTKYAVDHVHNFASRATVKKAKVGELDGAYVMFSCWISEESVLMSLDGWLGGDQ